MVVLFYFKILLHLFFTNDIVGCFIDDLDVIYDNSGDIKSVHFVLFFVHSILYYSEHIMASMKYSLILHGEIESNPIHVSTRR